MEVHFSKATVPVFAYLLRLIFDGFMYICFTFHDLGSYLKWPCHEIFFAFFPPWIEPIWAPDQHVTKVSLQNSFSRRYSRNKWFCAGLHCPESDSVQACRLTLRGVNKKEEYIQYKKHAYFSKNLRKSKDGQLSAESTSRRLTLRGVLRGTIFSLQTSPCLDSEN